MSLVVVAVMCGLVRKTVLECAGKIGDARWVEREGGPLGGRGYCCGVIFFLAIHLEANVPGLVSVVRFVRPQYFQLLRDPGRPGC